MRALLLRPALLLGTLAAPFLPLPWSGLALLAVLALWLWLRPPRREVLATVPALLLAVVALGLRWEAERESRAPGADWVEDAAGEYRQLWSSLREEARAAADTLQTPPSFVRARLDAFRRLEQLEPRVGRRGRRALLLLDPDGVAVAWAGEGLLHEAEADVPRSGLHYQASFSAVTLLAIEPLPSDRNARRPWRVVAGVSFPTDTLPFPVTPRRLRWSLIGPEAPALQGAIPVRVGGAPTLVAARPAAGEPVGREWALRLSWGGIAFALLALAALRGSLLLFPPERRPPAGPEQRLWVVLLLLGGAFAAGMAASLAPLTLALVTGGLGLSSWGLAAQRLAAPHPPGPPLPSPPSPPGEGGRGQADGASSPDSTEEEGRGQDGDESLSGSFSPLPVGREGMGEGPGVRGLLVLGALAILLLILAAWGVQRRGTPVDLSAAILAPADVLGLRLAFAAAAFGLLCLAGARRRSGMRPSGDRWAWSAALAMLAGAALADSPALAVPLLAAGGAGAAVYADRRRLREGLALGGLALLAVLAAGAACEVAYRLRLREYAADELFDRLRPPSPRETAALAAELRSHFAGRELRRLIPRSPEGLERQDLAFALWRGSPLARPHALSALVIEPLEGPPSSFSFGLPSADKGRLGWTPERQAELRLPLWGSPLVSGEAGIVFAGRPWGRARWWLMPRPGFGVGDPRRLAEVEAGLLRGGPASGPSQDLPGSVLYALYAPDGRPALSPWEEEPPLPPRLRIPAGNRGSVDGVATPSGPSRAYIRSSRAGWEVVYLPFETPLTALERVASFGAGDLFLLAFAVPAVLLLGLPRASFRDVLRRAVRSYSKRLMIVYTVLLLVPLVLLNAVLVRAMEDRLSRQQRAAGEAALTAAQKVLGERLLELPLGFGVDPSLGDRLLQDLSGIVRHEMNLYYASSIYASSKHELFTAGLLPNRIPGETYSELALLGYGLSSRENRVGGTVYLEIYAPLRVPGVPIGEERLFLSMPLLAQQEETARELAHLRRHGLIATLAIFILLVAVGTRLARNFTRPLMQLVEGTRRIAGGATSLNLSPTELELAALVEAVDEMARRIAEGRERLVREKQVVERMVENITSGVVSLDRDGRVLMRNRVAAELLGAEIGECLETIVGERPRLAPVAAFLHAAGPEMARETVRLPAGPEGEREWSLVWVPVPGSGEPAALLVVEDATEVLRGQRLLAWAEMARIIAHEIKNPLTPIRLSAEHMREVWRADPEHFDRVFDRCTSNILTQVEELRSIASEFSAYSAILQIEPKPGDLAAAVVDLVEGYRTAPPAGVEVDLEANGPIPARFDGKLLQRALRNLLENALRAASAGGGRVWVRVGREDGVARISVLDNGPGVRPENLPRIFDPYFSTHDTGTGLGLPIARRVVEEHGGHIAAHNRQEGGLEVTITLPV